jgi:hypothetical protein
MSARGAFKTIMAENPRAVGKETFVHEKARLSVSGLGPQGFCAFDASECFWEVVSSKASRRACAFGRRKPKPAEPEVAEEICALDRRTRAASACLSCPEPAGEFVVCVKFSKREVG